MEVTVEKGTRKLEEMPPIKASQSPRFNLINYTERIEMLKYFAEHGYVVVANVCSADEVTQAKNNFWDFSENVVPDLKRDDPETWRGRNWIANASVGIHNVCGFNHSEFLWNARLNPKVKQAFEILWNTDDLIVSFDAGNVFRPWAYDPTWITDGGWWHIDQNSLKGPKRQGLVCVQGFVTYYDANEHTGGLCVIPGSHLIHDELCQRIPMARANHDFVPVPSYDPLLLSVKETSKNDDDASVFKVDTNSTDDKISSTSSSNYKAILVCAQAGDLVLWDSRLVHCNTPAITPAAVEATKIKNTDPKLRPPMNKVTTPVEVDTNSVTNESKMPVVDIIRLCAYVCMIPRSVVTTDVIASRKVAFINRVRTNHWPDQLVSHGLESDNPVDLSTCSREKLLLVGYTYWDGLLDSRIRPILCGPRKGDDSKNSEGKGNGQKCSIM